MATSGQTLNDRINAARYALAGQGLARCVCKATTEEVIGPKKKHLDYLLACTHEPNVSIPQLANLLIERTNHIYWVVVFKALVTVHHLMSYGNERFTQYLASSNYSFELSTFLDKTAARDFSMSTFIRRYSRYINEKALSYRLLAFDFCKVKRGAEGVLRLMPIDRLLKTLPILENQLDALLEFDCTANDLNNGVINACFMLLFRDLIGLFACHNDGIINLLNKYFTLNKKMCREAFEHYKKFLVRMDKVSEFLRVAEAVGIDKDEIPDLRRTPNSLIEALEQHLQNIESNKKILKQQSSSVANSNNKSGSEFSSVLGNLTPPSSSSSQRPHSPSSSAAAISSNITSALTDEFSVASFRDDEVRRALEEEARVLSQYGSDGSKNKSSSGGGGSSSASKSASTTGEHSPKFAVTTIPKSIDDIFGDADSFATSTSTNGSATKIADTSNASVFDNLNTTPSTSATTAKHRPDLDSIKSTIQSATTTLEKSNSSNMKGADSTKSGPKKASDELFSLLDSASIPQAAPVSSSTTSANLLDSMSKLSTTHHSMNPLGSTTLTATPFDLPTNGQSNAPLKPGNPFPDISNDFATPIAPVAPQTSSIFKSPAPTFTGANYTNLGGLEGFGDLLQPMNSSNNNNGKNSNTNNAFGQPKSTFSAGPSLSSTGLFKGDLDSTLANLAQNLTFEGISKTKK